MHFENNNAINNLKKEINIVQVIGHYLTLHKKGNNFWAICPFHSDTNPSLSISESKQLFNCFSCNTKGDVFNFIQFYKNVSYAKAILEVCELLNLESENLTFFKKNNKQNEENEKYYQINFLALKFFQLSLVNINAKEYNEYIKKRGFTKELIDYFSIGCALNKNSDLCDALLEINNPNLSINMTDLKNIGLAVKDKEKTNFFINRIIFPIHDEYDNVVGFSGRTLGNIKNIPKYKNTETTKIFKKDEILYNYNRVSKNLNVNFLYLCEGFMDVISLYSLKIDNAVALMGLNLSNYHIKLLKKLKHVKEIVVALDNDEPGIEAAISCSKKLLIEGFNVSLLKYPNSSIKDVDELISNKDWENLDFSQLKIDYFEYLIDLAKNKIKKNASINEIVISVEKILYEIKAYSNPIVWNKYLELLSQKFELEISDLKEKFKKIQIQAKKKYDFVENQEDDTYNDNKDVDKLIQKIKKNCFEYYELILNIETYLIVLFYYHSEALNDFNKLINIKNTHPFFQKVCLKLTNYYKTYEKISMNYFFSIIDQLKQNDESNETKILINKIYRNIKYEQLTSSYKYDDLKKEVAKLYEVINLFALTKNYLKNIFLYLNDQKLYNQHLKNVKQISDKNKIFYEKIMNFKKIK